MVSAHLDRLRRILTEPTQFFREELQPPGRNGRTQSEVAEVLALALVVHWLGTGFSFLWKMWVRKLYLQYFQVFFQFTGDIADVHRPGGRALLYGTKDRLFHWFIGTASVLADPFLTVFSIFLTAVLIFAGARILTETNRSFRTALLVASYGTLPSLLNGLPIIGGAAASVGCFLVTVIGIRETYKTATARAVVITLFPKLIFVGIIGLGVLFVAYELVRFVLSMVF